MSGVPTSFHIGPLLFHLYGFGLAIAAYVTYLYIERRLRRRAIATAPLARWAGVIVIVSLVGARAANVATNWGYYSGHPGRWLAFWQGGISSFGGIGFALRVALYLHHRWWPETSLARFADAVVPALVAGWALGRVLGPQFMVQGGGHLTHQWFGLHYVGQVGKRVPVPLIQGAEDATLWLVLLWLERRHVVRRAGVLTAIAMIAWGIERTVDERLLLGQQSHSGSIGVQLAGLVLSLAGVVLWVHQHRRRTPTGDADPDVDAAPARSG